jgi:hypothetical protein
MTAERTPEDDIRRRFPNCTPFVLFQKQTEKDDTPYIPNWPPPGMEAFAADMKMGEEEAMELVASFTRQAEDLYDQSMLGDELAAAVLADYASTAVQVLEHIARRKPEVLHKMSMEHIRWPSFIGIKEIQNERNQALIKKLRLGENSPFRHRWDPKSRATHTAYSMLYWLNENQSLLQLPPLSKDSFEEWFKTGWQGFCENMQNHPERYQYLRDSIEKAAAEKVLRSREKRNLETVIKEQMKKAVKQGFKSITRKVCAQPTASPEESGAVSLQGGA